MTIDPSMVNEIAEAALQWLAARTEHPTATYRVQFHPQHCRFRDAAGLAGYLRDLGVSHLYASPCRRTRAGGENGYAIVDYTSLNPELGDEGDYRAMVESLHSAGLRQILDIVPNHMSATAGENPWWTDVLENGRSSPYAGYFDINWSPQHERLKNRVLLPVLGEQYGQVLEAGQLRLEYKDGAFRVRYWETRLPLDPKSYALVLGAGLDEFKAELPPETPELPELESILTAIDYLPSSEETAPARVAERQREKEVVKNRLRQLVENSPAIATYVVRCLESFNGVPDDPSSFDALDRLLDAQVYRLAHWKAAADEINYRRFFDVNELAAVCMEDPAVFHATHAFVFNLLLRGDVAGLRIDHVDGLLDPAEYLWRLQWGLVRAVGHEIFEQRIGEAQSGEASAVVTPAVEARVNWDDIESAVLHEVWRRTGGVAPSKVFPGLALPTVDAPAAAVADANEDGETVAAAAVTRGQSGQAPGEASLPSAVTAAAALNATGAKSTDSPSAPEAGLGGDSPANIEPPPRFRPFYVVVEKILSPDEPLPADWPIAGTTGYDFLAVLNGLFVDPEGLKRLTAGYKRFIDQATTFQETAFHSKMLILRLAMSSELTLLAHRLNRLSEEHRRFRDFTLNTLRTALREILACFPVYRTYLSSSFVSDRDRWFVHRAVAQAKRRNPAMPTAVLDFVRDVLLFEQPPHLDEAGQRARAVFVGRFQQVTSPVMAKGVEDTAFYRYVPLCSLNDVGCDPNRPTFTPDEFLRENEIRGQQWPAGLLATTTHDTKRSEDVRARINVLSEVPRFWQSGVSRWSRLNRRHCQEVEGLPAPSRNDEYLYYSTLIGAWPIAPLDADGWRGFIERMQQYMEKACREAKQRTSWLSPNAEYEAALHSFVAATLEDRPQNRFLASFRAFQERVATAGQYTALSQLLLKLMSPGTPDIYQGQELWDLRLVDPDNRHPVDFAQRAWLLDELQRAMGDGSGLAALAAQLGRAPEDNRLKLFVTWRALQLRRAHDEFFRRARCRPVEIAGEKTTHLCAFIWELPRGAGGSTSQQDLSPHRAAAVVAPRWLAQLTGVVDATVAMPRAPLGLDIWGDTRIALPSSLAGGVDLFTGRSVNEASSLMVGELLQDFPVAVVTNLPLP